MKPKLADIARKMAHKSSHTRARVGCVIARRSSVIGLGFNDGIKTHAKSNHPYKSIHAEFDAVLSARGADVSGCTAYVCRVLKNGELAMAKPCVHCEAMLRKLGIKEVWYSTDEGWCLDSY